MAEQKRTKVTLIESDESPDQIRSKMTGSNLVEIDIVVRRPDKADEEDAAVAARLCGCRRICITLVEP